MTVLYKVKLDFITATLSQALKTQLSATQNDDQAGFEKSGIVTLTTVSVECAKAALLNYKL